MSILIKGMEIPSEEVEPLRLELYADGTVFFMKAPDDCYEFKAVPVPPHGRLIDADALMNEFEKAQRTMQQHGREYSCSFMSSSQELSTEWYCVEDMLDNAPTIIPAEEDET